MRSAAAAGRMSLLSRCRRRLGVPLLAAVVAGCAADTSVRRVTEDVSPVSVGDPGEVSAKALASSMLRAGFSRDEILDLGPGIRRSLAQSGGAQAKRRGEIVALFSHKGGRLYVTSGNSGTFVTDM